MRVLFTTQAGSGHWRPLAPLAKALEAAGHEIAFATTPVACAALTAYGFPCFPVGADDWLVKGQSRAEGTPVEPVQAATVWVEVFVKVRATATLPDVLTVCRGWQPDLLVHELTEFAGCVAAERLGLPHATFQVGAWRPDLHRLVAPALNRLRAGVDLPPDPDLAMLYRHLLLTPVPPSFQFPDRPLPATAQAIRYVPFDHEPGDDERAPTWVDDLPPRPTVYATLGTAYNRTPGIFAAILDALGDEPLNLVVAVGPHQDPADFGTQPAHIRVERYVPQSVLFPRCDLAIMHGGFGSVLTALGHGLPMVLLPIAADQPDNARRCAELGVAEVVGPDVRTPEAIRAATRTVLREPDYRQNTTRLRDEIQALPGLEHASRLLEQLAMGKRLDAPTL